MDLENNGEEKSSNNQKCYWLQTKVLMFKIPMQCQSGSTIRQHCFMRASWAKHRWPSLEFSSRISG
jgi:hypothetical protein